MSSGSVPLSLCNPALSAYLLGGWRESGDGSLMSSLGLSLLSLDELLELGPVGGDVSSLLVNPGLDLGVEGGVSQMSVVLDESLEALELSWGGSAEEWWHILSSGWLSVDGDGDEGEKSDDGKTAHFEESEEEKTTDGDSRREIDVYIPPAHTGRFLSVPPFRSSHAQINDERTRHADTRRVFAEVGQFSKWRKSLNLRFSW